MDCDSGSCCDGTDVIKKRGNKYDVVSKSGKRLGKGLSKKQAEKRLRQVEYFKHKRGK